MFKKNVTLDQQASAADRGDIAHQLQIAEIAGTGGMLSSKWEEDDAAATDCKASVPNRSIRTQQFPAHRANVRTKRMGYHPRNQLGSPTSRPAFNISRRLPRASCAARMAAAGIDAP